MNHNDADLYLRDAMRKRGLCCRKMAVCPSVTRQYCVYTAKPILKLFDPLIDTSF